MVDIVQRHRGRGSHKDIQNSWTTVRLYVDPFIFINNTISGYSHQRLWLFVHDPLILCQEWHFRGCSAATGLVPPCELRMSIFCKQGYRGEPKNHKSVTQYLLR